MHRSALDTLHRDKYAMHGTGTVPYTKQQSIKCNQYSLTRLFKLEDTVSTINPLYLQTLPYTTGDVIPGYHNGFVACSLREFSVSQGQGQLKRGDHVMRRLCKQLID